MNPERLSNHVMCRKSSSTATLMKSFPCSDIPLRREIPGDRSVLTFFGAVNVLPPSRDTVDTLRSTRLALKKRRIRPLIASSSCRTILLAQATSTLSTSTLHF